jgi:murein L,D-transpeptidase YafK
MKQFSFSHFIILFSLLALVSFTIDKGKKKKPAGKTRTAKLAQKPRPVAAAEPAGNPYYIIVDKSDYELKVYDEEGWYATYPIVFGSKDLSDKMKEGDKRTPDGQFKVVLKKIHPKWGPELLLDYPNDMSIQNLTSAKPAASSPKMQKLAMVLPYMPPGPMKNGRWIIFIIGRMVAYRLNTPK